MARSGPRFSLVEAALLICLIAVVLAVFVPNFVRRIRTNKISEATELLEEMSRRTRAYYETSWSPGSEACLPSAAGPTPATPTADPESVDFLADEVEGRDTWRALSFQPDRPVRFSYSFLPSRDGCGIDDTESSVVLRARGDLDGDGVFSTFERRASVGPRGFTHAEALLVHQRTE